MTTQKTSPKYPNIMVRLSGTDGNAFSLLGLCKTEARKAGLPQEQIAAFFDEATASDYNHLLATCMRWFDCN